MRVLITGSNGFTAVHLIELLSKQSDIQIFRTDLADCDLAHYSDVEKLISSAKPHQIYHLAGSFTNTYEKDYKSNVVSTKNLLDSLIALRNPCRVLLIGSAAEYGIPEINPILEEAPLKPVSIYGLTKAFQTLLMQHYCAVYGLDLVMARTFNLMGKGISKDLFIGQVYHQIDLLKRGKLPKLQFGDLSSERDYIGVREAALYYQKIMHCGLKGSIYNVGSGTPVKISELLSRILKENDLPHEVVEEQNRPQSKVGQIYADIRKLSAL